MTRCGPAVRASSARTSSTSPAGTARALPRSPGGLHYADDTARIFLQGSTQYDALGHVWYDGKLWNGYDARSTVGAMEKASVLAIAEKGVSFGRGVLIDMARHRGKQMARQRAETFDHNDLEAAAKSQGVEILPPTTILVVRTGWMKYWYELDDRWPSTTASSSRA